MVGYYLEERELMAIHVVGYDFVTKHMVGGSVDLRMLSAYVRERLDFLIRKGISVELLMLCVLNFNAWTHLSRLMEVYSYALEHDVKIIFLLVRSSQGGVKGYTLTGYLNREERIVIFTSELDTKFIERVYNKIVDCLM